MNSGELSVFGKLVRSRKFWLLVLDTVISMLLFFGGKYLTPAALEDLKFLIATIQPVFVMLIAAIAYEDAAALRQQNPLMTAGSVTLHGINSPSGVTASSAPIGRVG